CRAVLRELRADTWPDLLSQVADAGIRVNLQDALRAPERSLVTVVVEDREAADHFLSLCKRPVGDRYLAASHRDLVALRARQQPAAHLKDADLSLLLGELAHPRDQLPLGRPPPPALLRPP